MWDLFVPDLQENAENYRVEKQQKRLEKTDEIKQQVQNLPDMLNDHNTVIKFWVPEVILQCIAEENWKSISEATRDFFIEHCYGKQALKYLYEQEQAAIQRKKEEPITAIYRMDYTVPYELYNLGKNCCGIKLGCHSALKEALTTLAKLNKLSLSEYLRRILITHYLGNGFIFDFENQFKLTKTAEKKFNQIDDEYF